MQPIKILRITSNLSKGGAGNHVLAIHRALNQSREFQSYLWCPRETIEEEHAIPRQISRATLAFNFLRTRALGLDSFLAPQWNRMFRQMIPQFDIIHLHHLQGYFFDLRSLQLLEHKNVVLTLHDMWPLTGRCSISHDCEKWKTRCRRCPHLDVYPSTWIDFSRFLHQYKAEAFHSLKNIKVVALSNYAAARVRESHFKGADICVIPPGIRCDDFKPQRKKPKSWMSIGVVAAKPDFHLKGFDALVRLVQYLDQQSENRYRIQLVGGISLKTQRSLQNYKCIDYFPFTNDPAQLGAYYNDFDVLLNFSQQETFGKTNIEAQAAGTPVLARDIPPFRENVFFGAFFEGDEPEHICNEIKKLASREWDRGLMHRTIKAKYDLAQLGERYTGLYQAFFQR
jgi:putative colanic acid biosynthesis glycosyltransferase